ncbi:MAG: MotA/TolQ/ExbB proton channel family protein [Prevotellaceae bacterium]|nr:MotA/TolQ/ExbB proton channel family protein [Prevotellaceae bacterium]
MKKKNVFRYAVVPVIALALSATAMAQDVAAVSADTATAVLDSASTVMFDEGALELDDTAAVDALADGGVYGQLKSKFMDGGVFFMSLVAIVLILGLACCIERIVYLCMSEIDAKRFMGELEAKLNAEGVDAAKELCRNTRGPVASICYQGLLRVGSSLDIVERSVTSYASVQLGNMEKGCSWITLFIAMAPSLGFLGTVIGMVMSFDQIELAGDISPTIVASGMKVALITTIFGIITALVLQLFYNYVLSKIDHLTAQMEESAITLMDILKVYTNK